MSYNANVTSWNDEERRNGSFVVLAVAIVLALGAVAAWWFALGTPQWVYWALVVVLALVLGFMAVLLVAKPREAAMAAPEAVAQAPVEEAAAPAEPAPVEPRILTLRCGDCGTIFEITDSGERPLYHTCPGCGAEGALRDEPAAEAAPEAAPDAAYAPPAYEPPAPEPAPIAAEPTAPPVKKLKLRCGGCKEVFAIEDTGERPLKRACPHCGRIGKIG